MDIKAIIMNIQYFEEKEIQQPVNAYAQNLYKNKATLNKNICNKRI